MNVKMHLDQSRTIQKYLNYCDNYDNLLMFIWYECWRLADKFISKPAIQLARSNDLFIYILSDFKIERLPVTNTGTDNTITCCHLYNIFHVLTHYQTNRFLTRPN